MNFIDNAKNATALYDYTANTFVGTEELGKQIEQKI